MLRCNAILSFSKRQRKLAPLTIDQLEERALLKKQWAHYKHDERSFASFADTVTLCGDSKPL